MGLLWNRELLQAMRSGRSGVAMCLSLMVGALFLLGVGSALRFFAMGSSMSFVVSQIFLSAMALVAMVFGTFAGASSVCSEKQARTWDLLLLTPISPARIVLGKWSVAMTRVGWVLAFHAPLLALCVRFGQTSLLELVLGYAMLFAVAAPSAALGVWIGLCDPSGQRALSSAAMSSLLLAPLLLLSLGFGASFAVHFAWPSVPGASPIWLPRAWLTVPISTPATLYLLVIPTSLLLLTPWLLYEMSVAYLSPPVSGRCNGIKRWYLAALGVTTVCAIWLLACSPAVARNVTVTIALGSIAFLSLFALLLFSSEPDDAPVGGAPEPNAFSWVKGQIGTGMFVCMAGLLSLGATSIASVFLLAQATRSSFAPALFPLLASQAWGGMLVLFGGIVTLLRKKGYEERRVRGLIFLLVGSLMFGPAMVAHLFQAAFPSLDVTLLLLPSPLFVLEIPGLPSLLYRRVAYALTLALAWGAAAGGLWLFRLAFRGDREEPATPPAHPLDLELHPSLPARKRHDVDG